MGDENYRRSVSWAKNGVSVSVIFPKSHEVNVVCCYFKLYGDRAPLTDVELSEIKTDVEQFTNVNAAKDNLVIFVNAKDNQLTEFEQADSTGEESTQSSQVTWQSRRILDMESFADNVYTRLENVKNKPQDKTGKPAI